MNRELKEEIKIMLLEWRLDKLKIKRWLRRWRKMSNLPFMV